MVRAQQSFPILQVSELFYKWNHNAYSQLLNNTHTQLSIYLLVAKSLTRLCECTGLSGSKLLVVAIGNNISGTDWGLTFFILMDYSIHIDAIIMELSILHFEGLPVKYL